MTEQQLDKQLEALEAHMESVLQMVRSVRLQLAVGKPKKKKDNSPAVAAAIATYFKNTARQKKKYDEQLKRK